MSKEPKFVGDLPEDVLIRRFFAPLATELEDDVALVEPPPDQQLLVTTDALLEGIHFLRESPPQLIAQKALRVNVSDLLASGGRPQWFTLAISLPRDLELRWLSQFAEGLQAAIELTGMQLIGGDTTAAIDKISISITAFGSVAPERRVSRSGARPGDWIGVTGNLGNATVGLDVILGKHTLDPLERWFWLERHFLPPLHLRFAQAAAAQGLVTAMMDLSDGLLTDLPRLCKASKVGALVEMGLVPVSAEAAALGLTPKDAVRGGEDFELLFACHPTHWHDLVELATWSGTSMTQIGSVVEGQGISWLQDGVPQDYRLPTWKHFG